MEWEKRRECGAALCVARHCAETRGTLQFLAGERDGEHNVVYKKTQDVGRVWRMGGLRRGSGVLCLCGVCTCGYAVTGVGKTVGVGREVSFCPRYDAGLRLQLLKSVLKFYDDINFHCWLSKGAKGPLRFHNSNTCLCGSSVYIIYINFFM